LRHLRAVLGGRPGRRPAAPDPAADGDAALRAVHRGRRTRRVVDVGPPRHGRRGRRPHPGPAGGHAARRGARGIDATAAGGGGVTRRESGSFLATLVAPLTVILANSGVCRGPVSGAAAASWTGAFSAEMVQSAGLAATDRASAEGEFEGTSRPPRA